MLVLRFGAYGDVLLTAAAVAALRRALPDARIAFGVRAELAEAVRHHPGVDELVVVEPGEGVWSYARKVRAFAPEAVLDLHGRLRSVALRVMLFPLPFVSVSQRSPWERLRVALGAKPRPAVSLLARFQDAVARLLGRAVPAEPRAAFAAPEAKECAAGLLVAAGIVGDRPLLGLSPGANWATKRWPAERYAEVARLALAEGWAVAVVGSAAEAGLCAAVCAGAPGAVDLGGRVDLATLPGFVARCTAFVSNDSGPAHLALGLGVPTVAVFGSTDPAAVGFPDEAAARVVVDCGPCSFHGRRSCPRGDLRCLSGVAAEAVWARARERVPPPP